VSAIRYANKPKYVFCAYDAVWCCLLSRMCVRCFAFERQVRYTAGYCASNSSYYIRGRSERRSVWLSHTQPMLLVYSLLFKTSGRCACYSCVIRNDCFFGVVLSTCSVPHPPPPPHHHHFLFVPVGYFFHKAWLRSLYSRVNDKDCQSNVKIYRLESLTSYVVIISIIKDPNLLGYDAIWIRM
jgi:hypothetical protein